MRFRLTPALLLIASAVAAQPTTSLPRSAPGNGFTDSTLHTCIDSAGRTRACSIAQLRKVLPFANLDSMRVSLIPSAHDSSSRVAVTRYVDLAVSAAVHGVVDSATGATRAATLTTSRTLWGQSFNGSANVTGAISSVGNITGTDSTWTIGGSASTLRPRQVWVVDTVFGKKFCTAVATCLGAITYPLLADNGTAAAPSYAFSNSTGSGLYRFGADTVGIATGGVHSLRLSGGASPTITGGQGSMTLIPGTGNSRRLTVQTTTSSGTATTAVRFNEVQQSLFASGSAARPGITFAGDTNTGVYSFGPDTIGFATGGVYSLHLSGGSTPILTSNSGNLTLQASTTINGNLSMGASGQIFAVDGSAGGPSWSFINGATSGAFLVSPGRIGYALRGVEYFRMDSTGRLSGGANNFTLLCGTGNSRTCAFQSTTSGGVATTALRLNEVQQALFTSGTATRPGIAFASDSTSGIYYTGFTLKFGTAGALQADISSAGINVYNGNAFFPDGTSISPGIGFASDGAQGLYRAGAGTLGLITSSVSSLVVSGGASATITGGAGSFTLQCGTGNSRTCTFRTTNSSGTATTFASGAGDTLKITAHAIAAGLTAASGTPHAACFDATTHEMEDNAAPNCTVSARRFKQNIGEVSAAFAWNLLKAVPVDSFTYRAGGRRAFGTIADDLAPIDERLITRDAKGLVNAANYEQLGILTLLVQRDDHRRIDSLITALRKKP